ncbi:MAG: ABC transporter ATP-binding protein [Chloroflexi bacterium]|nr:ABC transporter ATP-binding protein [Chloroflexota bacterium]
MISISNLTKRFGETVAVKNLSLEIKPGELIGLIGPDGAGKTTTMRVVSTAMNPTSGRVTVGSIDTMRDPEAVKKLIGYMPQRFALYPDLTVLENLNFFADVFGSPRAQRAELIHRLLGFARLTEFQTRLARNLSGGMQKKLALAATLMHRPQVLLLDEPTTGVDPVSRREFWDLLTQVHLDGVTIVICTPYLDEAERCTRVGLMYRGELIAYDDPRKLREEIGVKIFEAQSEQALQARQSIENSTGVLTVSTHGDMIRMIIDRTDRMAAIKSTWQASGISVGNLHEVKPRLEDAFVLMLQKTDDHRPPTASTSRGNGRRSAVA